MTTLQTISLLNSRGADPSIQRAHSVPNRADDAPGFASVLDAFTESEDEIVIEQVEDSATPEDAEPVESDEPGDAPETTNEESPAAEDSIESSDASTPIDENTEQIDPEAANPSTRSGQARAINSASDLAVLLTNAATIDLAAIATKQLKGDAPQDPGSDPRNGRATINSPQSEESKRATQPVIDERGTGPKPKGAGVDYAAVYAGKQGGQSLGSSTITTNASGAISSNLPELKVTPELRVAIDQASQAMQQARSAQPSNHAAAMQTIQPQTTNPSGSSDQSKGVRSLGEIAGTAGKSTAISASESSGQSGSQQSGMDLGSRPQGASKLLNESHADDRAMQRQQVLSQVQRGLASIMNTKGGTMKLRLAPEHLGEVKIQLTTKDGQVSVQIDAKNDATRSMLSEGLVELRNAMEARGATVDQLRVEGPQQSGFERIFGHANQNSNPNSDQSGSDQQHSQQSGYRQDNEQRPSSSSADTDHESRSIWTDLGLDAIA